MALVTGDPRSATVVALSIGVWVGGGSVLVPLGVGVTAYGAAYLLVHDVVIHRRLPWIPISDRVGARLRAAHNVHHLYGRAPFGFLVPVVPRQLARRADTRASRASRSRAPPSAWMISPKIREVIGTRMARR